MARPCKVRKISFIPENNKFGPISKYPADDKVIMSLDEYEVIRLIDYEHLTQEETAKEMNIARTTVQAIYDSARFKLSCLLISGSVLEISGGNVKLKQDLEKHKIILKDIIKEDNKMIIAVTYENGEVYQHFGHTEEIKLYEVVENKIVDTKVVSTNGQGHAALVGFLKNNHVDVLICGGIGGGAQVALKEAGITLYGGVSGLCDDAVAGLLTGELAYNPDVKCEHHDHEHGEDHHCGSNGCGHCHH